MSNLFLRQLLAIVIVASGIIAAQALAQSLGDCTQTTAETDRQCMGAMPCAGYGHDVNMCFTDDYSDCPNNPPTSYPCDGGTCHASVPADSRMTGLCGSLGHFATGCVNCTKYYCGTLTHYQYMNIQNQCQSARCTGLMARNNACIPTGP